jgi:hypothetical protein
MKAVRPDALTDVGWIAQRVRKKTRKGRVASVVSNFMVKYTFYIYSCKRHHK